MSTEEILLRETYCFPSLKEIAYVKVGSLLLTEQITEKWLEFLPEVVRIGCENVRQEMNFLFQTLSSSAHFSCDQFRNCINICWTPYGSIDVIRTYENVAPSLDPAERLKLACYLCLQDQVMELSDSVSLESVSEDPHSAEIYVPPSIIKYFCDAKNGIPPIDVMPILQECIANKFYYPTLFFWKMIGPDQEDHAINLYSQSPLCGPDNLVNVEVINMLKFILSKMCKSEQELFYAGHASDLLFIYSYSLSSEKFLRLLKHFISRKFISPKDSVELCMKFFRYSCYPTNNSVDGFHCCDLPRHRFNFTCLNFVLNVLDYDQDDSIAICKSLTYSYQRYFIWNLDVKKDLVHMMVCSKVVQHVIEQFSHQAPTVQQAYEQVLSKKSVRNILTFMFHLNCMCNNLNIE